jgi:hypothetical protein
MKQKKLKTKIEWDFREIEDITEIPIVIKFPYKKITKKVKIVKVTKFKPRDVSGTTKLF